MNEHPNIVKETLMTIINKMSESPELYVKNPSKDFTRNRKLPFGDMVKLLISMGGNSIYKELLESQGYNAETATTSAFVQQRDKILPTAFEFLLNEFTKTHQDIKTHRGYRLYRLLVADGSDLHSPTNPFDTDTFFQNHPGEKGYNLLHLNAMYDLCNRLYVDAIVQPGRFENEYKAFVEMTKRSDISGKVIVIADRNYESFNNFAHIENKNWNYLIRVKDLDSNGILSSMPLPQDDEFDVTVTRVLTRVQTNVAKAMPGYHRLAKKSSFDFFGESEFFTISLRVVRIKIDENSYETLITNLDCSEFNPQELKELYRMRWGIETSFRELKYAVGLNNFHAKKKEYIVQEIYSRIIMYNFAEMIISHIIISKPKLKHACKVNFTVAIHICRHFLRSFANVLSSDVDALISKNILPVRPNRKYKRKVKYRSAVSFIYRVA